MHTIRIATRGSAQARMQAESVGSAIVSANPGTNVEYVLRSEEHTSELQSH